MNNNWLENSLILYGCGLEAEKFICRNMDLLSRISFCIDGYRQGTFHGKCIKKIEEVDSLFEKKIVVAALPDTYKKLKDILRSHGLSEFKHFVHISYIEKKLIIVNANCHGPGLINYLNMSKSFRKKYVVYDLPEIHTNIEKEISQDLLDFVDVLITQDVREDNRFSFKLSMNYLKTHVNKECDVIVIPNMVGMGRWIYPQHGDNGKTVRLAKGEWPLMHENLVLEEAVKSGFNRLDEYVKYFNSYTYDEEYLVSLYSHYRETICSREIEWDIKVAEYIEKSFRKMEIFEDRDHPSVEMMKTIGQEVIKRLGLPKIDDSEYDFVTGLPIPILPSVKEYYGIEIVEQDCLYYYNCNESHLVEQYIKNYLYIMHDIIV